MQVINLILVYTLYTQHPNTNLHLVRFLKDHCGKLVVVEDLEARKDQHEKGSQKWTKSICTPLHSIKVLITQQYALLLDTLHYLDMPCLLNKKTMLIATK